MLARSALQTARYFHSRVALDLVVFLHVAVILDADAAFGSGPHLVDVVLEAFQGFQSALENDDVVPQHADRKIAAYIAVDHHAARDRAEFARAEHAANRGKPHDLLLDLGRQHAGEHCLDVIDGLVNDAVVADIDSVILDGGASRRVTAHIEGNDARLGGCGQRDVGFGQAADAGSDDVHRDFAGGQAVQCIAQCLHAALHVGLHQELHEISLALAHGREHILHVRALLRELDVAGLGLAVHGDFARLALALDHQQLVARIRRAGQSQHHHRYRRSGPIDGLSRLVEQRPHPAEFLADEQRISELEGTAQHEDGRDGAAAFLETGLEHVARREPGGRGFQLEHLGLQQDAVDQLIHALSRSRGYRYEYILAAPFLGNHAVLGQLLLDLLRVGFRLVHLVQRNHDRHFGRLRVLYGLDRLRHDAVVGADDQDDDIRDLRTSRAHGRKRRGARRVEKSDHALGRFHMVRADVLRDAARLACGHLGAAYVVEQRRLAVIDVAHHRHDRRTRQYLERGVGLALQIVLYDVFLAQHRRVAHFLHDQDRGVLLDHLIDRGHHAHVHHHFDDFGGFDGHLLRQLSDRHGFADRHLAYDARGRHLETMLGVRFAADRTAPAVARLLLLVPRTHVPDDVQFLPAVARGLVVHLDPRGLAGLCNGGRRRLALALGLISRQLFGDAARFLLGGLLAILFIAAPPALLLETLAIQPFLLEPLMLRLLDGGLGLLFGFALPIQFLLLMARLILQHLSLDVGALAAHFDVHGPRPPLRARELQLGLRFSPPRDLARSRVGLYVVVAVAAPQVGQQLVLRVLADHVFGALDPDAGLIELLQQPIDRDLQHLGELGYGNVCHTCS